MPISIMYFTDQSAHLHYLWNSRGTSPLPQYYYFKFFQKNGEVVPITLMLFQEKSGHLSITTILLSQILTEKWRGSPVFQKEFFP